MTIVVGVVEGGKVTLAADTQGSAGWDKTYRKDKKVFKAHGILYGFTSSYRMGQILQYHTEEVLASDRDKDTHAYVVKHLVPMWRRVLSANGFAKKKDGEDQAGVFLVGIDGRLFRIDNDFQVGESVKPYEAVGCGESYALGAMFALYGASSTLDLATNAVETAMEFSNGCGGSIDVITSD